MPSAKIKHDITVDFKMAGEKILASNFLSSIPSYLIRGKSDIPLPYYYLPYHQKRLSEIEEYIEKNLHEAEYDIVFPLLPAKNKSKENENLWFDLCAAWLYCDWLSRTELSLFATSRHIDEHNPHAAPDTFPSLLIGFGTTLREHKDMWGKFHVGRCLLAELGIGFMWQPRTEDGKSTIHKEDVEILEKLIINAPMIVQSCGQLFNLENRSPAMESNEKLFVDNLADEMTYAAIAANSNTTGNWIFYKYLYPTVVYQDYWKEVSSDLHSYWDIDTSRLEVK